MLSSRAASRVATFAKIALGGFALAGAADSTATGHPVAGTEHMLNGKATAHLHLVKADGSQLQEEGP